MSNIALLVDCHKIISNIHFKKIGLKIARNYGRIGITTSRRARKRLKLSLKTVNGLSTIRQFTTILPSISKVQPNILSF